MPQKSGKSHSQELDKIEYVKVFELQLSNMEESPVYELTHQLTIGSEIGNIIIADPSVSPRHASFILQEDVVSVLDHGSVAGTMINGKKIAPGKSIILEETDVVNVGDLEIKILVSTKTAPAEVIPDLPELDSEPSPEPLPIVEPDVPKKVFDPREHLKKNSKNKKKIKQVTHTYAANALVRVFAVLSDLLLGYSVLIIFMPFDEFRAFMDFVPSAIGDLLVVEWNALWSLLLKDYAFVAEMLSDAYKFLSETFHFIPLFIMFILIRISSTLLLGVSISEFILGIRSTGNGVWARIGGVVRVILGIITGPFLIFDLPAVISKRTLKEFITFTCTTLNSKFLSILGIIFYVPFLLVLALVSPMLQGLEPPEPIVVSDIIDRRVKVKAPNEGEAPVEIISKRDQSKFLNMELVYDVNELSLIPEFKFKGIKSKLNLTNGLVFYQRDLKQSVEFEVLKKFDLKQLIGIGMRGNVFLYEKYPLLYSYVYSTANTNPSFKNVMDEKSQLAFANEFIRFIKMAFSLSLDNFQDIMQEETFLIKGLIDFKSSFLSLIEYKEFNQIGVVKIGNTLFLRVSYSNQKPFDLIIPLTKGDGKIFKVTWDKSENLIASSSKFYKFNLDKTDWLMQSNTIPSETMSALEVFDVFSTDDFKTQLSNSESAMRLYGYYFETSQEILKRDDIIEIQLWKAKVMALPALIEAIPSPKLEEGEIDPKLKLLQNFRDLIDALEGSNYEYFGISKTTTV